MVQLSHPYMISGKTMTLTIWTFVSKVMYLFFNMLSRFVITFLPRKVISWLRSQSAVTLKPKKRNFVTPSTFLPSICHEVMEPDAMIFVFWMLSFKPFFSLSSFTLIKRLFSSSSLSFLLFFFTISSSQKEEKGDRGWDGWRASPTQGIQVWASSRRWWRTGRPGTLQHMGSQRVGHDLATEQQYLKNLEVRLQVI